MKNVRVLMVVTLSETGGAQKVVYHLTAGLEPGLYEVTVACAPGGELIRWLGQLPHGVRVVEIPELKRNISPFSDIMALYRLYQLIRRERFDVVHCHSSKAGVLGRLAAWFAGVPKIFFTAHGWGINEYQNKLTRFFYILAERLAGAVSTGVVCVSRNDLAKGLSLRLAAREKLSVIYNGLPKPGMEAGTLRRELDIKDEDVVIGTVARLAPPKELFFLLETAERMSFSVDDSHGFGKVYYVIVGDGPLRQRCKDIITEKDLERRVFLLGAREGAAGLMPDFDIFVLFSRWEGLPLTIIEAMMAGRPVIANAVGGVGELVVHQETGLLIDQLDLDKAEEALLGLIRDPGRRLSMGENGRRRACTLFDMDTMVKKYSRLYIT